VRVALLSYRSKPHVGGQGEYVRHLSRELARLGHSVEVFSGQPYPELDEAVRLTKVPSLDLYADDDPFHDPRLSELRDLVDVQEWALMRTGAFPEPLTFAKRVMRLLAARRDDFDVVHDNQTLATPLLGVEALGLPLVTTIHHPISRDRRIELAAATTLKKRFGVWRWYSFVRMQARVARRLPLVLTPSQTSARDVAVEFGVDPVRIEAVPLAVDAAFVPPSMARVPGRIVAMASADAPLKGLPTLLEAFAKLRTERDVELVVVSKPKRGGPTEQLVERLSIGGAVRFVNGLSTADLVALLGSAEVGCVPSFYEGFSIPTAEFMACATPLVVSRAGAIPEVVGPDGLCADLVAPGDVGQLAQALEGLLDDAARRAEYGARGRARVEELFSWHSVAERTGAAYTRAVQMREMRQTHAHR
jgi:glycosyltransferase involved in cell wall biosynthesis